jgi:hypothetical protein
MCKIKEHITRNWGHVPICFKIGNVSPSFLHAPDFNAYSIKSLSKNHIYE